MFRFEIKFVAGDVKSLVTSNMIEAARLARAQGAVQLIIINGTKRAVMPV